MSWGEKFLSLAQCVASWSKDTTKVGCVLVSPDKAVLSTGYNGLPRGVSDLPERMERPAKYLWTSHAEENAVAQAARSGVKLLNATAYVTHYPCSRCARTLIQAGVKSVVCGKGKTNMPDEEFAVAKTMFAEAYVSVDEVK